jgi:enoyl-CoA hydratase
MYESYEALKIERRGRVLWITLDNPPMNAIPPQMHNELSRIFTDINNDPETAVVVLTGAGEKAFSAGGDINRMIKRIETADHKGWNQSVHEAKNIIYGMLRLEKPLIGRINGHAMGLGATIVAFCDFTYMPADARIADTHVKIGLTAGDGGALMWPLLIGFPMASGATMAINTTKVAINLILRQMLEGIIETHLGLETYTTLSKDHAEAAYAFRDKRTPNFTGE